MVRADRQVALHAGRNHGLVRRAEARAAGLSDGQIARRVRSGEWERIGPSVFRMVAAPRSRDQQILAATWRTGGVASHRTGIELHDLGRRRRPIDVSVERNRGHEYPGVVVHRTEDLLPSEVMEVRGIPVTDPTRTLVDVGAMVGNAELEAMVHEALHRGLTDFERLASTYQRISRPGRTGAAAIRRVLVELDPAQAGLVETRLEARLLRIIRRHGLPSPVLQHRVTVGPREFRLDVAYPEVRAFIEGDGFGVHGRRSAFEGDRHRQNLLVVNGWTPLRFTWRQLVHDEAGTADQIARLLARLGHPSASA